MSVDISQLVRHSFQLVAAQHRLISQHEINDGQQYSIDFICDGFNLRLDKYRGEFYPLLYKEGHEDRKTDLFNLLAYLAGDMHEATASEFFRNETNTEARYRQQLEHIASTVNRHYDEIEKFFRDGHIDSKFECLNQFMIAKYPNLFKRATDI